MQFLPNHNEFTVNESPRSPFRVILSGGQKPEVELRSSAVRQDLRWKDDVIFILLIRAVPIKHLDLQKAPTRRFFAVA